MPVPPEPSPRVARKSAAYATLCSLVGLIIGLPSVGAAVPLPGGRYPSVGQGATLFALLLLTLQSARAQAPHYDLLIENARIIDGTGAPPVNGKVAVKDHRIAAVGLF